jgi:adenylate kinase
MILVISGTPSVGKSSVAKELSKKLGWKVIHLNELAEEKNLYCGYDKKRKCKIVDLDKIEKELEKIAKSGKNLIIESHYAHDIPCDVVVILRCNPTELRKRMQSKGWSKAKIEENIEAEIMEICKSEALEFGKKIVEIDTTGKNPETVAKEIVEKLKLA